MATRGDRIRDGMAAAISCSRAAGTQADRQPGAGVDHRCATPTRRGTLGHTPGRPAATDAMSEYVAAVPRLHARPTIWGSARRSGKEREQKNAGERPVGVPGFGTLGQDAGRKLRAWLRGCRVEPHREKEVAGLRPMPARRALRWRRAATVRPPLTARSQEGISMPGCSRDCCGRRCGQCRARRHLVEAES
jgi:hypothetical protein